MRVDVEDVIAGSYSACSPKLFAVMFYLFFFKKIFPVKQSLSSYLFVYGDFARLIYSRRLVFAFHDGRGGDRVGAHWGDLRHSRRRSRSLFLVDGEGMKSVPIKEQRRCMDFVQSRHPRLLRVCYRGSKRSA